MLGVELVKDRQSKAPANRIALTAGHHALELRELNGWRGGTPVKLADQRAKFVLLDFCGWWVIQKGVVVQVIQKGCSSFWHSVFTLHRPNGRAG